MNWRDHITVDPHVCHGRACFRGTHVMVSVVLDNLATGTPADEILSSYRSLEKDAIPAGSPMPPTSRPANP